MVNRISYIVLIALLVLGTSCQSLKKSLQTSGDLPVHESNEHVTIMGNPAVVDTISHKEKPPKITPDHNQTTKSVRVSQRKKAREQRRAERKLEKQEKIALKSGKGKSPIKEEQPKSIDKRNYNLYSEGSSKEYSSQEVATVIRTAESFLGVPYRWGGITRAGVDCSGLMVVAFQSVGLTIPRVSGDQYNKGKPVKRSDIRAGDLVFFSAGRPGVIGHTALVVAVKGESVKILHATSGFGVRYDYLESTHWSKLYISASRYL